MAVLLGLAVHVEACRTSIAESPEPTREEIGRRIDQRLAAAAAVEARFRAMPAQDHLAAARSALADGFDPDHRIGGNLAEAERHLAAISPDAGVDRQMRELRREIADRRERAERRRERLAREDARHGVLCSYNVEHGIAERARIVGEVRVIRDGMPYPTCSGDVGSFRGEQHVSILVTDLRADGVNDLRQLQVGFVVREVPLDRDLDLAEYACIEERGDTGCLRSQVRLSANGHFYGIGARGTEGTLRVSHQGKVWTVTVHGVLGEIRQRTPPRRVDAVLTIDEAIHRHWRR